MLKGIDVSHHNGVINWEAVKASGLVDFAIIRDGYGQKSAKQIDNQFERNYVECKKNGIPVGVYHYSYAKTTTDALNEAKFVEELLKGKQFEFPVYYDMEEKAQVSLNRTVCSDMVRTFCEYLEDKGYWCGIYSFDSFFGSNLESSIPQRFATWVARVPKVDDGKTQVTPANVNSARLDIHQYSWKGVIPGISGDVDLNVAYKDFTPLIQHAKKNGYSVTPEKPKTYTVSAVKKGLSKDTAEDTCTYLKKLGMSVTLQEE